MTLGEVLGEARGKVIGVKALGDGKIEVSLQGSGKLLGSDFADVVTILSVIRPNGTAYSKGNSIQMSPDGIAEWQGSGVGRQTRAGGWIYSYGGLFTNATSEMWHRLLDVYTVGEYESDANGNYHWKIWEWRYITLEINTNKQTFKPQDEVIIDVTNTGNQPLEFPNSVLGLQIMNIDTGAVFVPQSLQVITIVQPGESKTFKFTFEELVKENKIGTGTIEASTVTVDGFSASTTFTLTPSSSD
jgi:hypothetical protein